MKKNVGDHEPKLEDFGVNLEILLAMLRRENELRLSPDVQEKYRLGYLNGGDNYVAVTDEVQKQVIFLLLNLLGI